MSALPNPAAGEESLPTVEARDRVGLLPRDLALIALFAALIAVLGLPGALSVSGSVPITAQSLGVILAGSVLGGKRGFLSVLAFLVLVSAGLPLLSGGRGGLAAFTGPSGGYLVSWPFGALVIGLLVQRTLPRYRLWWGLIANVIGGIVVIYAVGIPWTWWKVGGGFGATIVSAAQFVPGDLIKVVLAALITRGASLTTRVQEDAGPLPMACRTAAPVRREPLAGRARAGIDDPLYSPGGVGGAGVAGGLPGARYETAHLSDRRPGDRPAHPVLRGDRGGDLRARPGQRTRHIALPASRTA